MYKELLLCNINKHITKYIRSQYTTESKVENMIKETSEKKTVYVPQDTVFLFFLVLEDVFIFLNLQIANS